jgi:hypothetical protein
VDDFTHERWLPVVGYEGLYEVSDLGRVQSLDRLVRYKDGRKRFYPSAILKQYVNAGGYPAVGLSRNGKTTPHLVHWLVGKAFLGERPEGQQTLHGPKRQRDNSVANLSYGPPAKNAEDALRDGTRACGTKLPHAKLTDEIVRECRARYAAGGVLMKELAAEFGVETSTMCSAITRATWKHVA